MHRLGGLFLALVVGWALVIPSHVNADTVREIDMKAVFLFHFSAFVEWPPRAFKDPYAPFVIGVLGDDPFGDALDQAIQGEFKEQRPIIVRRFDGNDDFTDCHILYISQSEERRLPAIMSQLEGKPVLTVSDINDFGHSGGMIQFERKSNRIGLKIDKRASDTVGLQISSKLLRLAQRS